MRKTQVTLIQLKKDEDLLEIVRVSYGKKGVPKDAREYRAAPSSPVGCRDTWLDFAKKRGWAGILTVDAIEGETEMVYLDGETIQV